MSSNAPLLPNQRALVNQFKDITHLPSDEIATLVLSKYHWNLEQSIQHYFDGTALQNLNENEFTALGQSNTELSQQTSSTTSTNNTSPRNPLTSPYSNQINANVSNQRRANMAWYSYVGGFPGISFVGTLLHGIYDMSSSFLSFLWSWVTYPFSSPNLTQTQVFEDYIKLYGEDSLNIFNAQTFEQAIQLSKTRNKPILMYFYDPSRNDCERFSRDILKHHDNTAFLMHNMICWLGDLRNRRAANLHRQIARLLFASFFLGG